MCFGFSVILVYIIMSASKIESLQLMFSMLGKIFRENGIWHFMQIVSSETICMKCQILFTGKNKKNIINLSSAEYAQRVVKVKI